LILLPENPLITPDLTLLENSLIYPRTVCTSLRTSYSPTLTGVESKGALRAVWSTALFSVQLTFSPANRLSNFYYTFEVLANFYNNYIVSGLIFSWVRSKITSLCWYTRELFLSSF